MPWYNTTGMISRGKIKGQDFLAKQREAASILAYRQAQERDMQQKVALAQQQLQQQAQRDAANRAYQQAQIQDMIAGRAYRDRSFNADNDYRNRAFERLLGLDNTNQFNKDRTFERLLGLDKTNQFNRDRDFGRRTSNDTWKRQLDILGVTDEDRRFGLDSTKASHYNDYLDSMTKKNLRTPTPKYGDPMKEAIQADIREKFFKKYSKGGIAPELALNAYNKSMSGNVGNLNDYLQKAANPNAIDVKTKGMGPGQLVKLEENLRKLYNQETGGTWNDIPWTIDFLHNWGKRNVYGKAGETPAYQTWKDDYLETHNK